MAKFFFFEGIAQQFYTHVFVKPKDTYSRLTQLGITFTSGYLAGIICAVVSHPADTIVSLMGKSENKGKSVGMIAREAGMMTLATQGLGPRIIMIGTLTGEFHSDRDGESNALMYERFSMVDIRHLQDIGRTRNYGWQVITR